MIITYFPLCNILNHYVITNFIGGSIFAHLLGLFYHRGNNIYDFIVCSDIIRHTLVVSSIAIPSFVHLN